MATKHRNNKRRLFLLGIGGLAAIFSGGPLKALTFRRREKVYRNLNIQVRKDTSQNFYWETRPFGNPKPQAAEKFEGFISETVTYSNDGLKKIVETVWDSKESFLRTLPPEHFEQPGFYEWHKRKEIGFAWIEEYIDADKYNNKQRSRS